MTYEEFLVFRSLTVRDKNHERVIKMFYPYLKSVCGDAKALPVFLGNILGVDLSGNIVLTGCFDGIADETAPPYGMPDFYVVFDNGVTVYIYGALPNKDLTALKENEYVVFALFGDIEGNVEQIADKHFFCEVRYDQHI